MEKFYNDFKEGKFVLDNSLKEPEYYGEIIYSAGTEFLGPGKKFEPEKINQFYENMVNEMKHLGNFCPILSKKQRNFYSSESYFSSGKGIVTYMEKKDMVKNQMASLNHYPEKIITAFSPYRKKLTDILESVGIQNNCETSRK